MGALIAIFALIVVAYVPQPRGPDGQFRSNKASFPATVLVLLVVAVLIARR